MKTKELMLSCIPWEKLPLETFLHLKRVYKKLSWGNFESPQTFSEKLCKKNILDHIKKPQAITITSDKYLVRDYVSQKIGSRYLNELYGVYRNPWEISPSSLPPKFVVKCTHGSGWNIINKNIDYSAKRTLDQWMHTSYYRLGREFGYKEAKPKIIIEKYLEEHDGGLNDYKFFVFRGKAKIFVIDTERSTEHKRALFSRAGNFINVRTDKPIPNPIPKLPTNLDEMIFLSEKLGADFDFARIDFYESNGKIFFGEITHYPWGCMAPFYPKEFDLKLGQMWRM